MPLDYCDTPATERGDVSLAQVPALDFSIIQPFASPTKNPAEDLRNKMRGLRSGSYQQHPMRTPRTRNALVSRPNPGAAVQQEFTPLLKSARRKELLRRSIMEEKENALASEVPPTPAGFRSSYGGDGTQLPLNSSMVDEGTSSSVGVGAVHVSHAVSSSMLSATPMPSLPRDGQGGILEQGNVLSLRDQEAKLDQIQKENFGLKLKIHFLEEALRKTGSEYHQATLKENAELKTERLTIDADTKRQRKRLLLVEQEVEEYRSKYHEQLQTSRKGNAKGEDFANEIAKLQQTAEEAQRLADERLRDVEDLRAQLEEAQQTGDPAEEVQGLKDDIEDLNRALRDRDNQIDAKAEQLEAVQAELNDMRDNTTEMKHLQQDVEELEAELKEREDEVDVQNKKISELQCRLADQKANTDAQSDLAKVEKELEHKTQALDKAVESIGQLKQKLNTAESTSKQLVQDREQSIEDLQFKLEDLEASHAASSKQREDALRNVQREIADKDGEIRALQERVNTARGSWDAEAQQTDGRLQEKDRHIKERDAQLREKSKIIEQRDDELDDLQRRLRAAESRQQESVDGQSNKVKQLSTRIYELEQSIQLEKSTTGQRISDKDKMIEAKSAEVKSLKDKLNHKEVHKDEIDSKQQRIRELETSNREQVKRIATLEAKETPSRKTAQLKEQSTEIQSLKDQLHRVEKAKDAELDELERELEQVEKENLELQQRASQTTELENKLETLADERDTLVRKIGRLDDRARAADKDQSILGHQTDELSEKQAKIEALVDELDKLETACRGHERQVRVEIEKLRTQLEKEHATIQQALEDDIVMLENALDQADAQQDSHAARIAELEQELKTARLAKETGTPIRERNSLSIRLADVESERDSLRIEMAGLQHAQEQCDQHQSELARTKAKIQGLQSRIDELELQQQITQEDKTIAEERQDLHDLAMQSKLEAEELQFKLKERDRKISALSKREGEVRGQLEAAQLELEDLQSHAAGVDAKITAQTAREKQMRAQIREYKEAGTRLDELELQLGDRNSSSSGHARREAELRTQLRDAKIGLESLQIELAEKEDRILALVRREHALRQRIKKTHSTSEDDATVVLVEDLQAQLDEAEEDIRVLRRQLSEREQMLSTSQKKEMKLRSKVKEMQQDDGVAVETQQQQQQQRHYREIKGLAKQIQFLRARCTREEGFRKDLIYTKRWFLLQVEMYNECNQADLRLLEEMGITPDQTFRQRKPTLRTLGLTVLATIRMQKMSAAWTDHKQTQESLVRKLEAMQKSKSKARR